MSQAITSLLPLYTRVVKGFVKTSNCRDAEVRRHADAPKYAVNAEENQALFAITGFKVYTIRIAV